MATLVLGAAGAALGGPAGAAIGRFAGSQIDRSFGASATRRISDLRLPSAQYGDPIPSVRGRMRVAGVVLWCAPPVPIAVVNKDGSAQSLSVSFALAVSSSPIAEVGRIWADGRLIRDSEGQQSASFTLRLHSGSEDQASDPLVAAIEGESLAPAYRGIAYIVFENLDLSSFGSRLPLITVEVFGGEESVTTDDLLAGALGLHSPPCKRSQHSLVGASLIGDNVLEAVAPYIDAFIPTFRMADGGWTTERSFTHHLIAPELWALKRQAASKVGDQPTKVSFRFFDPDLEFAAGERSARVPGAEKVLSTEVPAAMSGGVATGAAFEQLVKRRADNRIFGIDLPLSFASIAVGDQISSRASPHQQYVVGEKRFAPAKVSLLLRSITESSAPQVLAPREAASAFRFQSTPMSISLVELHGDLLDSTPRVAIAVTGGANSYRPVPVTLRVGGATRTAASASLEGACGELVEPLDSGLAGLIDRRSLLRVRFANDPILTGRDRDALASGANLLWVNGEYLQFGTATFDGDSYVLSELIRGCNGSEIEVAHPAGSPVIFLDPTRLTIVQLDVNSVGQAISAEVHAASGASATASLEVRGLAAKPWRPGHLRLEESSEGIRASWVRRCKPGIPWLDHVDSPLGYAREIYHVTIEGSTGQRIEKEVEEPTIAVSKDESAALGPKPWTLSVRQIGDFVAGEPTSLIF